MTTNAPGAVLLSAVQQRPFAFSDPFIMRVEPDETVGQLRQRVQVRDPRHAIWTTKRSFLVAGGVDVGSMLVPLALQPLMGHRPCWLEAQPFTALPAHACALQAMLGIPEEEFNESWKPLLVT